MMLNRSGVMDRWPEVAEGTSVYSQDGSKLGEDSFTIQKGIFFPKDFTARYDDIQDYRDGAIYLGHSADVFNEWRDESYSGWGQTEDINAGRLEARPRDEYRDRYKEWGLDRERMGTGAQAQETRIPVAEERLEAHKVARQAGEVKVHKIVHTEYKHFTVPVMREEVRVERVPVGEDRAAGLTTEKAFKDETVTIPVMEEEVTVSKRPVVKEEVVISKDRVEEQREVEGEVRREDVDIENEVERARRKKAV